jgi:hypothetical protein
MSTQATTPAFTGSQPLTEEQRRIIAELVQVHGLDPSQISFDGFDSTPIFDYEAVSTLTLKLTDIQHLDAIILGRTIEEINSFPTSVCKASCLVTLPDGRTRSVEETAYVGEVVNGRTLETTRDATAWLRTVQFAAGSAASAINLWRAHQAFMRTGASGRGLDRRGSSQHVLQRDPRPGREDRPDRRR